MSSEINALQSEGSQSAQIRREHINHEASIRSIGVLYYLGAVICIFALGKTMLDEHPIVTKVGLAVVYAILTFIYVKVGSWLRALDPKARTPATILAAIGLLAFPLGTLINGYILYLLQSKKGTMVFSNEYKEVIKDTPEIKYKTSILIWILVGIVILGLVAAMLIPLVKH